MSTPAQCAHGGRTPSVSLHQSVGGGVQSAQLTRRQPGEHGQPTRGHRRRQSHSDVSDQQGPAWGPVLDHVVDVPPVQHGQVGVLGGLVDQAVQDRPGDPLQRRLPLVRRAELEDAPPPTRTAGAPADRPPNPCSWRASSSRYVVDRGSPSVAEIMPAASGSGWRASTVSTVRTRSAAGARDILHCLISETSVPLRIRGVGAHDRQCAEVTVSAGASVPFRGGGSVDPPVRTGHAVTRLQPGVASESDAPARGIPGGRIAR